MSKRAPKGQGWKHLHSSDPRKEAAKAALRAAAGVGDKGIRCSMLKVRVTETKTEVKGDVLAWGAAPASKPWAKGSYSKLGTFTAVLETKETEPDPDRALLSKVTMDVKKAGRESFRHTVRNLEGDRKQAVNHARHLCHKMWPGSRVSFISIRAQACQL